MSSHNKGHDRQLLAVRLGREGFGSPARLAMGLVSPPSGWCFLEDAQVLDVLVAPKLKFFRPPSFHDAIVVNHVTVSEFNEDEKNLALSAALVCRLVHDLNRFELSFSGQTGGRIANLSEKERMVQNLAKDFGSLADQLEKPETVQFWRNWNTISAGLPSLSEYQELTKRLAKLALISATRLDETLKAERFDTHNPDGSRPERFIRDYLAPAFQEIYQRKAARPRKNGDVLIDAPFMKFVFAFFGAARVKFSSGSAGRETIAKALSPGTKLRKQKRKKIKITG